MATTSLANYSFAACNVNDVPLGSGNVSSGTSIVKVVENQNANGTGGQDGDFSYSFNSGGQAARCGRHADGTWWLAPAVGQSKVSLTAINSSRNLIRAEDNPDPAVRGFLNNAQGYGRYDDSKNIRPSLPISYPLNSDSVTSIFSVIQRERRCGTNAIDRECIEYADFLTIYNSAPPQGGRNTIRPVLYGNSKRIYSLNEFDVSRVPKFSEAKYKYDDEEVASLISKWTATTEVFSLQVCDSDRLNCQFLSEGGRAFRSHAVINDYAADGLQNNVLSYFLSDESDLVNNTSDRALLAAVLANGIDVITLIATPPGQEQYSFSSGAGQFMNQANFSYFTAALSQRDGFFWNFMKNDVRAMVDSGEIDGPQEMQQVYDYGNGPVWGDAGPTWSEFEARRYWAELMSGLAHENSGNWFSFTADGGRTYTIRDEATGRIPPAFCETTPQYPSTLNSVCKESTVLVDGNINIFFDYTTSGTSITFDENIPAGTRIEISPITNRDQGALEGNRASGDPYGFIDGPPGVPTTSYFAVSNRARIDWAGIGLAIPELCEVINFPPLFEFVERYLSDGAQTQPDPCAPPSEADIASGVCAVFTSRNCVDYGLVNNGTARWGPDPRDPSQCIANNRLLTFTNGTWIETVEQRGDRGRFPRFHGGKITTLPSTFDEQYLAFKGNRSCSVDSTDPGGGGDDDGHVPVPNTDDDLLMMIPPLIASINNSTVRPDSPTEPISPETPSSVVVGLDFVSVINVGTDQYNVVSSVSPNSAPVAISLSSSTTDAVNFSAIIQNGIQPNRVEFELTGPTNLARGESSAPYTLGSTFTPFIISNGDLPLGSYQLVVTPELSSDQDESPAIFNFTIVD